MTRRRDIDPTSGTMRAADYDKRPHFLAVIGYYDHHRDQVFACANTTRAKSLRKAREALEAVLASPRDARQVFGFDETDPLLDDYKVEILWLTPMAEVRATPPLEVANVAARLAEASRHLRHRHRQRPK